MLMLLTACDIAKVVGGDTGEPGDSDPANEADAGGEVEADAGGESWFGEEGGTSSESEAGSDGESGSPSEEGDDGDEEWHPSKPGELYECYQLLRGYADEDLTRLTVAIVEGQSFGVNARVVLETSEFTCLANTQGFEFSRTLRSDLPPGPVTVSLREAIGDPDQGHEVGQTLYQSQPLELGVEVFYTLVLSNNFSQEVLAQDPREPPENTYALRYYNLSQEVMSLYAWDFLDRDAAPTVLVSGLDPGEFPETITFPTILHPDGVGYVPMTLVSDRSDLHPLEGPENEEEWSTGCVSSQILEMRYQNSRRTVGCAFE